VDLPSCSRRSRATGRSGHSPHGPRITSLTGPRRGPHFRPSTAVAAAGARAAEGRPVADEEGYVYVELTWDMTAEVDACRRPTACDRVPRRSTRAKGGRYG